MRSNVLHTARMSTVHVLCLRSSLPSVYLKGDMILGTTASFGVRFGNVTNGLLTLLVGKQHLTTCSVRISQLVLYSFYGFMNSIVLGVGEGTLHQHDSQLDTSSCAHPYCPDVAPACPPLCDEELKQQWLGTTLATGMVNVQISCWPLCLAMTSEVVEERPSAVKWWEG